MIRRTKSLVGAAAAVTALAAAAPASADFHFLCSGAGSSLPGLTVDGSDYVFSASVSCPGVTGISITNLQISSALAGFGSAGTAPSASCGSSPCSASGRTPALPGLHSVSYTFSVTRGATTATAARNSRWVWIGAGPTVAACRRDAPPNASGC